MIIKTLVEDTSIADDFGSEHGLSIYIETKSHRILFDVGASDLFYENAMKLDADIAKVDFLVISHGHNDHGGGLARFLRENSKAKVFLHPFALKKYYVKRPNNKIEFIGLEEELSKSSQIVFTADRFFISEGVEIFSNVIQKEPLSAANSSLLAEKNGYMTNDTFSHEQNLIIEEDGKTLLLTGCAHNGIINILSTFGEIKGCMPDFVIGGFHLSSSSAGNEKIEVINKIGKYLLDTKTKYYTCHCTGLEPYNQLKNMMGEKIDYLSAGSQITI